MNIIAKVLCNLTNFTHMQQDKMRLSKFLAHAGIGARRKVEEYISAGKVRVNNEVVTAMGTLVDPTKDHVTFYDRVIQLEQDSTHVLVYKPQGYISSTEDTHGRKTVLDLLPEKLKEKKWIIVGRLDRNSEGLIFLTTDGHIAHTMMHPSFEKEKEYLVYVRGTPTKDAMKQLSEGVNITLEDGKKYMTAPIRVKILKHDEKKANLQFILKEGKKRQIRLMCDAIGHPVMFLKRLRIGDLDIGDMPLGSYRYLTSKETKALSQSLQTTTHES